MAETISARVGNGGVNHLAYVKTIQGLLNRVPASAGGPSPALEVDGKCGAMTSAAIRAFQSRQFGPAGVDLAG